MSGLGPWLGTLCTVGSLGSAVCRVAPPFCSCAIYSAIFFISFINCHKVTVGAEWVIRLVMMATAGSCSTGSSIYRDAGLLSRDLLGVATPE